MKNWMIKHKTWLFIGLFLMLVGGIILYNKNQKDLAETGGLEENFEVRGKINGASGMGIFIEAPSDKGTIPVAEGQINTDGTFEIHGNIPGLGYYFLRLERDQILIPITLKPGDHLKINTTLDEFVAKPTASGTDWSQSMNLYLAEFHRFQKIQEKLQLNTENLSKEEVSKRFLAAKSKMESFSRNQMLKNPGNAYNIILSMDLLPSVSFDDWDANNLTALRKVTEAFEEKYAGQPAAETFRSQYAQIENAYFEFAASVNGTVPAPEIALPNPAGKTMKLSDLKGKVVLLDFWASWCGPCRGENPNVVRLYQKFKNKGFTVFSVSLDEDVNSWKAAIQKDQLSWPTHVSDLKGWKSPLVSTYGFDGIPFTILLNKEGNIIGKNLRGEKLEEKLNELLK
ncbi:MAG: peroxiredoxin family protein [Flavobacteriales bacterium]